MAEMPDERDITKQQLWGRIDTAIETIATVGRNTNDNLQSALSALQRNNEISLAEFKAYLKNTINDIQSYIDGKIKFIEKLNNDGFGRMVNESMRLKQDVDRRMQMMNADLDKNISKQIQDSYIEISKNITDYVEKVNEYKKNSDIQISSVQKETGTKLGEAMAALAAMKKNFKKISEQLQ